MNDYLDDVVFFRSGERNSQSLVWKKKHIAIENVDLSLVRMMIFDSKLLVYNHLPLLRMRATTFLTQGMSLDKDSSKWTHQRGTALSP